MREKSQEKKTNILRVTLDLIAEQGFHGTSIAQIANKANVNVGSIYYHFKNKDDILNALYIDCKVRMTERVLHDCTENLSADKRLKHMMANIIRYFSENSKELSFIEQFENSPYLADIILTAEYTKIMKPYEDIYEQLRTQHLIKDLPNGILQSLLTGSIISLTKFCMTNAEAFDESVLSSAIEAIWDMVGK